MSLEANKRLSLRLKDARNAWDMDALDELLTPDWRYVVPGRTFDAPRGPAGLRQMWEGTRAAFPDSRLTVARQIAEGDSVVTMFSFEGTHAGTLRLPTIPGLADVPATGRVISFHGIVVERIEGGRIAESSERSDALGMLLAVGAFEPQRS